MVKHPRFEAPGDAIDTEGKSIISQDKWATWPLYRGEHGNGIKPPDNVRLDDQAIL